MSIDNLVLLHLYHHNLKIKWKIQFSTFVLLINHSFKGWNFKLFKI